MAMSNAVWGIDIGQCGLKALRCTVDDESTLVADSFDFIEYPKILSQPEADPAALVQEALDQFLSRNDVKRDRVAISVSGQAGLARFFKPPPVDAKMLPEIVKYEAKQQIPFDLEDVIWSWQMMGGQEVDGFTLDAEIGLFAMKREQVFRAIKPFTDAGIELHFVQLSPLCVYNFILNEVLTEIPEPEEIDPEDPPESLIVVAMGTETTDLVITNGLKLWQRSIPLGGNHFTKQLSKELKLTFAKAEHLKRNARQADDPKTIFQAMRPVFNDLVTELQRSIGYFQGIDRHAKIGSMVMLGNCVKLPGLRQYLTKNLGYEVKPVESFEKLTGSDVVSSKTFQENLLSFPVCYGLCLQGTGAAKLSTNLLPHEFITARMVREKKPWAVACVGAVLLGLAFHYFFNFGSWHKVHPTYGETVWLDATGKPTDKKTPGASKQEVSWESVGREVSSVSGISQTHLATDTEQQGQLEHIKAIGKELVGNIDRKLLWIELMTAINTSLPWNAKYPPSMIPDVKDYPYVDRRELYIEYIESEYFAELSTWFTDAVKQKYRNELQRDKGIEVDDEATPDAAGGQPPAADPAAPPGTAPGFPGASPDPSASGGETIEVTGPTGPGWVIEIHGYHFHNSKPPNWGGAYVRNTLLNNLRHGTVRLPVSPGKEPVEFKMEELGIGYAILAVDPRIDSRHTLPNPHYEPPKSEGVGGIQLNQRQRLAEDPDNPSTLPAPKHTFTVQFCWQETGLLERLEVRERERLQAQPQVEPGAPAGPADDTVAAATGGGS